MKSMCHDARRNSPSVADCRPISSCLRTISRIASSSTARSASASMRPFAKSSRALQQLRRAEQAADVVGAERRLRPRARCDGRRRFVAHGADRISVEDQPVTVHGLDVRRPRFELRRVERADPAAEAACRRAPQSSTPSPARTAPSQRTTPTASRLLPRRRTARSAPSSTTSRPGHALAEAEPELERRLARRAPRRSAFRRRRAPSAAASAPDAITLGMPAAAASSAAATLLSIPPLPAALPRPEDRAARGAPSAITRGVRVEHSLDRRQEHEQLARARASRPAPRACRCRRTRSRRSPSRRSRSRPGTTPRRCSSWNVLRAFTYARRSPISAAVSSTCAERTPCAASASSQRRWSSGWPSADAACRRGRLRGRRSTSERAQPERDGARRDDADRRAVAGRASRSRARGRRRRRRRARASSRA